MDIQSLVKEKVIGNIKAGTKNEKGLPQKLSYFNVEEDKVTSKEVVEVFKKLYPNKPTKLRIRFISEKPFKFAYKRYVNNTAICIGNGKNAVTIGKDNKNNNIPIEVECNENCEHLIKGKCKLKGSLKFILDGIEAGGVWNLSTTGEFSISNIASEIYKYYQLKESIVNVPFDLTLSEQQSLAHGIYYSIDLRRADVKPHLVEPSIPTLQQNNVSKVKQLEESFQEDNSKKQVKKTSKAKVQNKDEDISNTVLEDNTDASQNNQDTSSNCLIVEGFMPTMIQGQKFDKIILEPIKGDKVDYILHPKANQEILKLGKGTVIDPINVKTEMNRNILCQYEIKQIVGPDGSWIEYNNEELKKAV